MTVSKLNQLIAQPSDLSRLPELRNECLDLKKLLESRLAQRPSLKTEKLAVAETPQQLAELSARTLEVQQSGNETLANVKKVTLKIKELDQTKENLSSSIRLLRQLRMLSKLYSQLDALLKEQKYEDLSTAVVAASDLIEYFRPFRPLPQISQLSQDIGEMESKIYAQVEQNFKRSMDPHATTTKVPSEALRSACQVLDSLDLVSHRTANRDSLINFYCNLSLNEYKTIFTKEDEAGGLENVERRFTYLKNKVINNFLANHQHFFPPEWPVLSNLVTQLLNITADSLVALVPRLNSTDSESIQLYLTVYQQSKDFESYLKAKTPVITSKLAQYISIWIDFQDEQLKNRVVNYAQQLSRPESGDEVLVSSKELISFYKIMLQQLKSLVSAPETLLQVSDMLANHLGKYATMVLQSYLTEFEEDGEDLHTVQVVNATAEYIIQTTNQLVANISTNSEPTKTEEIFEARALSKYRQVFIRSEHLICSYFQHWLDPQFIELGQQYTANKRLMDTVSKVSPYIQPCIANIEQLLETVLRASTPQSVTQNVGLRTAELICLGFLTTVMARVAKPLRESQVEQMLLDFGALKAQTLLRIPELCELQDSRKQRLESKVLLTVNQCEAVLKVLMSSSEPTETFVMNYQVLIKDRSTLNFRKVLDVKGIRFQSKAIDKFKMMASQDPQLLKENLLLAQVPTVPPPAYTMSSKPQTSFNFKKLGDFLRRE